MEKIIGGKKKLGQQGKNIKKETKGKKRGREVTAPLRECVRLAGKDTLSTRIEGRTRCCGLGSSGGFVGQE